MLFQMLRNTLYSYGGLNVSCSQRLISVSTWSPAKGIVVEFSGSEVVLEEVGVEGWVWALRFCSLALLPVHSLLMQCDQLSLSPATRASLL